MTARGGEAERRAAKSLVGDVSTAICTVYSFFILTTILTNSKISWFYILFSSFMVTGRLLLLAFLQ